MNNMAKLLAIGLVLGGGIGILMGSMVGNIPMGIVFGGGGGLILGLAVGAFLDRRISKFRTCLPGLGRMVKTGATNPGTKTP